MIEDRVIKYCSRAKTDRLFNAIYAALEEAVANAINYHGNEIREPIEVLRWPVRWQNHCTLWSGIWPGNGL